MKQISCGTTKGVGKNNNTMNGDNNMAKNTSTAFTAEKPMVFGAEKTRPTKPVKVGVVKLKLATIAAGQDTLNALITKAVEETGGTLIKGQINVYK